MKTNQTIPNLPEELKKNYTASRKNSPEIEGLKIAAALKLWNDRDFRDIKFDVPIVFGKKTMLIKVLAKHQDGTVFGVECASKVKLGWLRERVAVMQTCLPKDSYVVLVFPEGAYERSRRAVKLVDEVWVTGKNGKVNQMMFHAYFGKQ